MHITSGVHQPLKLPWFSELIDEGWSDNEICQLHCLDPPMQSIGHVPVADSNG